MSDRVWFDYSTGKKSSREYDAIQLVEHGWIEIYDFVRGSDE